MLQSSFRWGEAVCMEEEHWNFDIFFDEIGVTRRLIGRRRREDSPRSRVSQRVSLKWMQTTSQYFAQRK